jgi:hypothetical protein
MDESSNDTANDGSTTGWFNGADPATLTFIWVGFLACLVIFPLVASRRRRQICCARITQRRWNIRIEDGDGGFQELPSLLFPNRHIVRQYPVGDPRRRVTPEQAEELINDFIQDRLNPHTKTLEISDFVGRVEGDEEMGVTAHLFPEFSESDENTRKQEVVMDENEANKNTSISLDENRPIPPEEDKDVEEVEQKKVLTDYPFIKIPSCSIPACAIPACAQSTEKSERLVASECPICLSNYEPGDKVTWSSQGCHHAFHQGCIHEWLCTLGKNSMKKAVKNGTRIQQVKLCHYDMVCPVCRQDFVLSEKSSSTTS